MGLRVATNLPAMIAQRKLKQTQTEISKSYERLATGQRINHGADDPAGIAIAESLRSKIRSMGQAERNANEAISFVQVAEGGLTELGNILIRLRELGIQAGSDTVGDREREFIQEESRSLLEEYSRIVETTSFNDVQLLTGESQSGILDFQVGIGNSESDRIYYNSELFDASIESLGIDAVDYLEIESARESLDIVDEGLSRLFLIRAQAGSLQNNLQTTVRHLGVSKENLSAARSQIADADLAEETSNLVKHNIIQATGIAALAQANSSVQNVLRLVS